MTASSVVIGLGDRYRRDDGVGPVVAAEVGRLGVPVQTGICDPMALVDAWTDATLAVVIDAAVASPPQPGRVRRLTAGELTLGRPPTAHHADVAAALALGRALGRVPAELVVVTVELGDTGHGAGLSDPVAAAVPTAVSAVLAELTERRLYSGSTG